MKRLYIFFSVITVMFIIFLNCQQTGGSSGGGGGGGGDDGDDKLAFKDSKIAAGIYHTAAILDNGSVKCWGRNSYGQLGYGDTNHRGDGAGEMGSNLPTVDLGTGRTAVQIAAGGYFTVALLDNGTIKCWGDNFYGQLGYGDTNNRGDNAGEMGDNLLQVDLGTGRTAMQIAAGGNHTVVLLDNGTVKCWGRNSSGQLGYGDTNHRGDGAGEMGDNLPVVDLGTGRTAMQIAAGIAHTVVLLDNGTVKCWGENSSGQLGYGDINFRGDGAGEMGDSLLSVELGTGRKAIQIAAGVYYTIVLLDNGTIKCWGNNDAGQLGYGDTNNRGDNAGEMGDSLLPVELGTGRKAIQIAAGVYHTVVLLDNDTVKCWGQSNFGQLGYGDSITRGNGAGDMGDNLPVVDLGTGRTAMQIAAKNDHTVVLLDNGTIKCWGLNNYGQLGYGDTNNRGDNAGEMGDNLQPVSL